MNYSPDTYRGYRGLLSNKPIQRIYYTMKIVQLDKYGNAVYNKETEFTCLDLSRSIEEKFVLAIDARVEYPVLLNFRLNTHPHRANYLNVVSPNPRSSNSI